MPSPWTSAGAGAAEGLEVLLARQRQEDLLRLHQQQFGETQRSNLADEGLRGRQIDETSANRQAQTAASIAEHEAQNQDRDAKRALGAIPLRPIGSQVPFGEREAEMQAGAPAGLYGEAAPGDFVGNEPQVPKPNFAFKGTESQQVTREAATGKDAKFEAAQSGIQNRFDQTASRLSQESATRDAATNRRLDIMQSRPAGGGQLRTVKAQNDKGENVERIIDSAGNIVYEAPSQLTGAQKEKQAGDATDLELMNQIEGLGAQTKWQGLGALESPVRGAIKRWTGKGDDQQSVLRDLLSSLQAEIGHEKFGSAFTATERQMLKSFAPGPNMHPSEIQNRLRTLKFAYQTRMNQRRSGQQDTPITNLLVPQGGADAGSGATPSPTSGKSGRFTYTIEP